MPSRLFNNKKEKQIAGEYKKGAGSSRLAKKYNTDPITILNIIRRQGGKIRTAYENNKGKKNPNWGKQSNRKFSNKKERKIVREYKEKSSIQLAKKYSASPETILNIVRRNGGKIQGRWARNHQKFSKKIQIKIIIEYQKGASSTKLAKKYNTSGSSILNILQRWGIKSRQLSEAKRKFSNKKEKQIAKDYIKKSSTLLAKKYNVNSATILNIVRRQKGKVKTISEANSGKNNGFYGKHHSKKSIERMRKPKNHRSLKLSKKILYNYLIKKLSVSQIAKKYHIHRNTIARTIIRQNGKLRTKKEARKFYKFTERHRESLTNANFRKWKNPAFVKKMAKSFNIHPNKKEELLIKLFKKHKLPYKFTGDFSFTIDGLNPDFTNYNGQKKVIDHFGTYWHGQEKTGRTKKQEEQFRRKRYAKFGYRPLFIWENELKNPDNLLEKIINFNER